MEKGEHKRLSISWSIALFTTMDEPMDTRRAGACLPRIIVFFFFFRIERETHRSRILNRKGQGKAKTP